MIKCLDCKSGRYCSVICRQQNFPSHEKLCSAIQELECLEKSKFKSPTIRENGNLEIQNRLVKLIGNKPFLNCKLHGISSSVLWDTGSMISLVDIQWVKKNIPDADIQSISKFMGDEETEFKAANNTDVKMAGVVILEFSFEGQSEILVPFLVTTDKLSNPIVGYNVIENLVVSGKKPEIRTLFRNSLQDMSLGRIEVMINLIHRKFEESDWLGEIESVKSYVVPAFSKVNLKCKVKGDVKGQSRSIICTPSLNETWDNELIMAEFVGELRRGKTPFMIVEIRNPTGVDKVIKKGVVLGDVCSLSAVIPMGIFDSKSAVNQVSEVNEEEGQKSNSQEKYETKPKLGSNQVQNEVISNLKNESWMPNVDLSHLEESQRKIVEKLLLEECDVFSKNDSDIGSISDLQMDIKLSDEIPVNESYRHLPRKLYEDVKNYLNDLMINEWIQESDSAYASPIVC